MYIPDFDYRDPETLEEACGLLAHFGTDARVIAGGTDLISRMKNEMIVPKVLISIRKIKGLTRIDCVPGKGVVIGARATHNDLYNSAILQERCPSVSEAAHTMANNQVRNLGTVGGNTANAVPSADLPPILMALGALLSLTGVNGTRTVPLDEFFLGPQKTVISRDEILTHITIPDQPTTGSSYYKFGLRNAGALAVVGVAAAVVANDLYVEKARIVLGAVAPTPMRAKRAEEYLIGKTATEEVLEATAKLAASECKPISDIRASEEYRRDMVRVFTKRALRKALHLQESSGFIENEGSAGHRHGGN